MKTILLATNFSEASAHAIEYAAELVKFLHAQKLVLYSTYAAPVTTSPDISFSFVETEGLQKMNDEELHKSKQLAASLVPEGVEVETRSDYGYTEKQLDGAAHELHTDLVITGIENMSNLEAFFDGNSAMNITRSTQVPVLLVPPDAAWKPVHNIAWICDCKNLDKTVPVWNIKPVLKATGARLHVLHNDPAHKQTDEHIIETKQQIESWFPETAVVFTLMEEKELKAAVSQYVAANQIDLIISIPKKHSWFENLFGTSHTHQIAFQVHVPVLCVRAIG